MAGVVLWLVWCTEPTQPSTSTTEPATEPATRVIYGPGSGRIQAGLVERSEVTGLLFVLIATLPNPNPLQRSLFS